MPYVRLTLHTTAAVLLFVFLLHLIDFGTRSAQSFTGALAPMVVAVCGMLALAGACAAWLHGLAPGLERWVGACSDEVAAWLDRASPAALRRALVLFAGLSLFLELVLIRWESGFFPIFAMYKNFTLLSCFCGLGLGYALANRARLLLSAGLPVLLLLILSFTGLRYGWHPGGVVYGLLHIVPVREETSMFAGMQAASLAQYAAAFLPVFALLAGTFLLNALALLPVGQFCGALMQRLPALEGYGFNLLGSIGGVVLLLAFSSLWAGPVIWFGVAATMLAAYQVGLPQARRAAAWCLLGCVAAAGWPCEPLIHDIYSPYQLIQETTQPNGMMEILASGSYYQKVFDLAVRNANRETDPRLRRIVGYYELPFRTAQSLNRVAVVGAGSGNDVAAALRNGAGAVDAVEIDPAIRDLGVANHPEQPYLDPRVRSIVNDARNFFATTDRAYDAIVYGVLDSHVVASYGANVRVDSYVYTQEGLRAAYDHLKPGGLMSVAFALPQYVMGEKVFRILSGFPGAGRPVAVLTSYDAQKTTTFMVRRGAEVALPHAFMDAHRLADATVQYRSAAGRSLDLPTDDWPFFYMTARAWPGTYVASLALILGLAGFLTRLFLPGQTWQPALMPFFFLGGGFMLVETKAVTELGLIFGNTWQVVGITIVAILVMAYFANLLAEKARSLPLPAVFGGLLAVVLLGYAVATREGLLAASPAAKLLVVLLLASPMFFSGLIFSTLLRRTGAISGAMAYNLMGAMLGGALEYNSMQFGFSSLYLIAGTLYLLAAAAMLAPGAAKTAPA
jgi:spermidine synthase